MTQSNLIKVIQSPHIENKSTIGEQMFYCPECLRCWDKHVVYERGNIPSYGKPRALCKTCKEALK